jgi:hypothetical protein
LILFGTPIVSRIFGDRVRFFEPNSTVDAGDCEADESLDSNEFLPVLIMTAVGFSVTQKRVAEFDDTDTMGNISRSKNEPRNK